MGQSTQELSEEKAEELVGYALEHYLKHRDAVMKKLGHAHTATSKSIKDIDESDVGSKDRDVCIAYDGMWLDIIEKFKESGVSEDDLSKVDHILTRIPALIKNYYDAFVAQDKALQALLQGLESPEYKQALQAVKTIQSEPDMLSGLDPDEFDLEPFKAKKSVLIIPPQLQDTMH